MLFYYTPWVDNDYNASLLIANIVAEFNLSTYNSGVDPKNYISVADATNIQTNFELDPICSCCDRFEITNKMRDHAAPFGQLPLEMQIAYADVALLLFPERCEELGPAEQDRFGGGVPITHSMSAPVPYATSSAGFALGDLTAPHELGHVLGGGHQQGNPFGPVTGTPDCARGFLEPNVPQHEQATWQTVMGGYGGNCTFLWFEDPPWDQNCVRIPLWSNPDVYYQGKPTGAMDSPPLADAFMARALNMTMPDVAEWTSYPHAAPATPTLSSNWSGCYGLYQMSWTSQTHAEHYQLLRYDPGGQQWSILAYHGTGTSTSVVVPQSDGSWLLAVRACNGSGCSSLSSSVGVTWHSQCL